MKNLTRINLAGSTDDLDDRVLHTVMTRILATLALVFHAGLAAGVGPGIPVGEPAATPVVDFERTDLNGDVFRLSHHRGRWVVVNFWATWCGPCIREIPMLRALHAGRTGVTVVGVNFEEIADDVLDDFVARMQIDYPVVRAGEAPLLPFEPLKGLPSTFVVDPDGRLVAGRVGEVDRAWIDERLADSGSATAPDL